MCVAGVALSPTARFVRIVATNALLLIVGLVILEAAFGNWLSPNWLYSLNVLRNVDQFTTFRTSMRPRRRFIIRGTNLV